MKIIVTSILICISSFSFSQDIYNRNNEEKVDSFMVRIFPNINFIQTIAGNWGDTTSRYKIIGFYEDTTTSGIRAIILQSTTNNKFQRLTFDHTFDLGGSYGNNIASVFFYDVDKNGIRELVIVESGYVRCPVEIEEGGEKVTSWAACDACAYSIFEQKIKSLTIENIEFNDAFGWNNCTTKEAKEHLQKRKLKK